MKVGGQIQWNAMPICGTFKISCLMGKTPSLKDVLGNLLKGPINPFGSLVECHPITAKDLTFCAHRVAPDLSPSGCPDLSDITDDDRLTD